LLLLWVVAREYKMGMEMGVDEGEME